MTCFRLKDGTPVSRVLPYCRYIKFQRLIEKGHSTEEAYHIASTYDTKDFVKRDVIRKYFKNEPTQEHFRIIEGYICRHKCDPEEAIKWAVNTGRIHGRWIKNAGKM